MVKCISAELVQVKTSSMPRLGLARGSSAGSSCIGGAGTEGATTGISGLECGERNMRQETRAAALP